jgi:mono/diheme cytochrome c family protein
MRRWVASAAVLVVWIGVMGAAVLARSQGSRQGHTAPPAERRSDGWKIPPGAEDEKSPLSMNAAVLAAGKKLFASKCERCHGKAGKGNGPDSDPKYREDMDLTAPEHADRNPDGVIFYRIWNGRSSPKMPVFSQELSKEQVWALVAYVQTLRARMPPSEDAGVMRHSRRAIFAN